jgi:FAD/FMN-containing dehydrogenase
MTTRAAYSSDAGIFRRVPRGVVEPATVDEVRSAVASAHDHGWSIVGRGGGSSVAGNAIGNGLVIDTSTHFNRIISLDPDRGEAVVEPGVICDDLRAAAAPYHLTYGPDPSTHSRCTIGGMVANNACGSHSVAYGTAAQNLVDVTLMLADGREVTVTADGCDDPTIDRALRELYDRNADRINRELGRFPRQVSGYGLHYLGHDMAKAVAGSEGTIGIITRMTVKLVPVPAEKALGVLAFETVYDAAAAAYALRLPGVATIEGMGGDLLEALRSKQGQSNAGANLPGIRKGITRRRLALLRNHRRHGRRGPRRRRACRRHGRHHRPRRGDGRRRDARPVEDPGILRRHGHPTARRWRSLAELGGFGRPAAEPGGLSPRPLRPDGPLQPARNPLRPLR